MTHKIPGPEKLSAPPPGPSNALGVGGNGRPPDGCQPIDRLMLESVAAGILRVDCRGRIYYANPHARRLLTLSPQQLESLTLRVFEPYTIFPDGRPMRFDDYPAIRCACTGLATPTEIVGIQLPNGGVRWLTVSAVPLQPTDPSESLTALVTFVDSSGPLAVEESLRHTEDRYRRLVEGAPESILVHHNNRIVFINDAGVKLWGGTSPADFIGHHILEFVHPDDREIVEGRVNKLLQGDRLPLVDQRHLRLDGRTVLVEVVGMRCIYEGQECVQAIMRDVTARKRAEQQVRRQQELLRKFFNRIPLFAALFDRDGRIQMASRLWKRVLGWDRHTTLSVREMMEQAYPDPGERQRVAETIRNPPRGWQDFRMRVPDGRILDISWAIVELSDGARIAIGQDITRRRRVEEQLRQGKAELEDRVQARTEELSRKNEELVKEISERRRAEKQLHEKQRFMERMLSNQERDRQLIAYEIHDTFLQDVIGALMFIDTFYETWTPAGDERLERIDRSRDLLRKSIAEARRMISGLRPPIIDEQGIVAAIEYLVSEANSRGLEIQFVHAMDVERLAPTIEATMFRIVQEAITNLERHSKSQYGQVKITHTGDAIQLEIRDFGVGFNPEQVDEGHFGLQGIRERARLVGGSATIQSQPGAGTEILVTVPAYPDSSHAPGGF